VTKNYAEAAKWARLAADQGVATPQSNLGVAYENNQGVSQNYAEAVKWFPLAADQGCASAQYHLGLMYRDGHRVHLDYGYAQMWLNLSAAQNEQDAMKDRDWIATRIKPPQIEEAQRLASKWKPIVAKQPGSSQ